MCNYYSLHFFKIFRNHDPVLDLESDNEFMNELGTYGEFEGKKEACDDDFFNYVDEACKNIDYRDLKQFIKNDGYCIKLL